MLRKDVVTNRVQVTSLPKYDSATVTLIQKAVRPDGKERTITQKVPVHDECVRIRLLNEAVVGTEIEATIVTEWHKNGYTTYLSEFHVVSASSSAHAQALPMMAKIL